MRFRPPNIKPGGIAKGWVSSEVAPEFWHGDSRPEVIETMIQYLIFSVFPLDYRILGPIAVHAVELATTRGTMYVRVAAPMMRAEDYEREICICKPEMHIDTRTGHAAVCSLSKLPRL